MSCSIYDKIRSADGVRVDTAAAVLCGRVPLWLTQGAAGTSSSLPGAGFGEDPHRCLLRRFQARDLWRAPVTLDNSQQA